MNRILIPVVCLFFAVVNVHAATVAVFPTQGVNVDKSFSDAFGTLLANKYEKFSGDKTLPPLKSGRAIGTDSNLKAAAQSLDADEYLEINAVGLYLSRKEIQETTTSDNRIVIIKKDDDDDSEEKDQQLLDNSKTIVTVTRMDKTGNEIYKTEMTLLTYGDIEESTERIALSLFKKLPIEKTRSMTNITRREGMGNNGLFIQKSKGPKFCLAYPVSAKDDPYDFSPLIAIGFDLRAESERFFLEFGAGGKFPSVSSDSRKRVYGGIYTELGASYFFINKAIGVYGGIGVIPQILIIGNSAAAVAPYLQFGISFPRNSRMHIYSDIRIAQHVIGIETGDSYDSFSSTETPLHTDFPTEISLQIGIGF
jgi:hypothetical protein